MSEFNLGDRLRVTNIATDTGVDVDVISVEEDLSDGERGLRLATPEGYNVYKYESVLADEELRVELVKPAAERLPTEPGQYIEVNQIFAEIAEIAGVSITDLIDPQDLNGGVWTLNADGTWTDFNGASRPVANNWILAVSNSTFVKAPEGVVNPPYDESKDVDFRPAA